MHLGGAARKFGTAGGYEFGRFRLDPDQNILWHDGHVLPLGPKVVQTLSILLANFGQVISRQDLIRHVWSDTAVEDSNLAHNISVLRRTLREDPSCNFTIETVPRRGYRFCETHPAVAELPLPASRPKPAIAAVPPPDAVRFSRKHRLGIILLSLVLLAAVAAVGIRLIVVQAAARFHSRRSVAVVGFANLSQGGDSSWLSSAISEMMTTELGAGGKLLTTPGENVARARTDLKLDDRDGFSRETLNQLRRNLNADLVISGAYTVLPPRTEAKADGAADNQVRLDLRVQNAVTGETVDVLSETGAQSNLFDLVAHAGERVRRDLAVDGIAPTDAEQARLSVTANPQSLRLYAEGIEKMQNFDPLSARDLLQQAVTADPDYAVAQSALAEAWMMLGYDQRAAESAQTALSLSGKLALEQKLLIEARYREAAHQWTQAIAAYQTLFDANPDNLEYGLKLTRAQRLGAQLRDALVTIQALRALPGPAASDPRIDLEETMAAASAGEEAGAQRAASAAERKGRERGSDLLIAEAKLVEPMSKLPGFVADQQDALRICQNAGNMDCVGQAWLRIGQSQNPKPAAKAAIEQALAIFGRVGDQRRYSEAQGALGVLYMDRGDFAEGHREYAAARATCEKIGDRSCVTKQVINDGNIDYASGDVVSAEKKYREALALARATGENQLIWGSLNNIANLLTDYDGNLSQAEALYRELVEMDRKSGKEARLNFTLSNLGAVVAEEGRLEEARSILKGVESWAVKQGQRAEFGSSAITLAQIDLAEGRPADAEARLQSMAKILEDEDSTFAISYYNFIALAQLAQNLPVPAEKTLAHARSLLTDSNQSGFDSYYLAITESRATVALHPDDIHARENSLLKLKQLASRCRSKGITDVELEARLAEGQIEMRSGLRSEGPAHLASLEHDAMSKGFVLIAQQASDARQIHDANSR